MLASQQQQMSQQGISLNPNLFHHQMAAALQMVHEQNQQQHQAFAANQNLAANSALMGLMSLRNGLIDYSRMIKIPTSRKLFSKNIRFIRIFRRTPSQCKRSFARSQWLC